MFKADPGLNVLAKDIRDKTLDLTVFQAVAEQAPDAIIFVDTRGIIRFWNESANIVFGYSPVVALGRSLDLIIPDRLREAHWRGFYRAIEFGQTRPGSQAFATRAVHQDGDKLYVELSFAVIKDRAGTVVGALAIARDITIRYVADATLKKRLCELEVRLKERSQCENPVYGHNKSG